MSTAPTGARAVRACPGSETPDEAVYLPGRNLLLTVKAAVWCRLREIETLALGSLGSNPFPDSTPDFFRKLESLLNQAMEGRLKLIRPFDQLAQDRRSAARQRPAPPPDLLLHQPGRGQHCGACNKCAERKKGFADAGVPDQTSYHR